jgi:hypothetical protein
MLKLLARMVMLPACVASMRAWAHVAENHATERHEVNLLSGMSLREALGHQPVLRQTANGKPGNSRISHGTGLRPPY